MGKSQSVREVVERVVSASLATHVSALKEELIERACEQLEGLEAAAPAPAAPAPTATPPGGASTDLLNAAFLSVLDSSLQADILAALVEGAGKFAERVALFVIRAGVGNGWRARGLNGGDIKNLTIDINSGLAARAIQDRAPASASGAQFDPHFVSSFGLPAEGTNALVLPLVIRDKVSALVYADAGRAPGGRLDPSALECLVRSAGLWLEVVGARKAGTPVAEAAAPPPEPAPPPPPHPVIAAPPPPPPPPPTPPAPVMSAPAAAAAPAPAPVAQMAAVSARLSPEDEEVHKKAKRFAKLLMDEIKLYNQPKLEQGRRSKDIYARLKDDIDKSRGAYDKRYGQSVAASADYFNQELIRILCDGDPSLLGGGFSR